MRFVAKAELNTAHTASRPHTWRHAIFPISTTHARIATGCARPHDLWPLDVNPSAQPRLHSQLMARFSAVALLLLPSRGRCYFHGPRYIIMRERESLNGLLKKAMAGNRWWLSDEHNIVKQLYRYIRIVQELCESRGGRPGLSVLTSLLVSVDVKVYWTVLRHWSQLVPNMSNDIWGH